MGFERFELFHLGLCLFVSNLFFVFVLVGLISAVNEIHSSATRKNKEWQEKLPIVVLKAEEIMYSKANSEV